MTEKNDEKKENDFFIWLYGYSIGWDCSYFVRYSYDTFFHEFVAEWAFLLTFVFFCIVILWGIVKVYPLLQSKLQTDSAQQSSGTSWNAVLSWWSPGYRLICFFVTLIAVKFAAQIVPAIFFNVPSHLDKLLTGAVGLLVSTLVLLGAIGVSAVMLQRAEI